MRQVIDSEWLRCSQDEADGGEGGGEGGVGRGGGGRGRGTEDFIDEPSVLKRMKLNVSIPISCIDPLTFLLAFLCTC